MFACFIDLSPKPEQNVKINKNGMFAKDCNGRAY